MSLLSFEEGYAQRIWGGNKLRTLYGKDTSSSAPVGEAWLIADHEEHVSVVSDEPDAGRKLCELLMEDAAGLLGSRACLTTHGRFPLLLKLLDVGDKLSIQVHPDDECAKRLGEPDVGKTEMWYVLQGDEGSELYCGLKGDVTREVFADAIAKGTSADLLARFPAMEGTSVLVPAGTVHAIRGGCLLAEIQQSSDITYRIYDWDRVEADGSKRELHIERALEAVHFGSQHAGAAKPLSYASGASEVSVLAACNYFAAESVQVKGRYACDTRGESFTLLLATSGGVSVQAGKDERNLPVGTALMVRGSESSFYVEGEGSLLKYYVADLQRDVVTPLRDVGHPRESILALGGDSSSRELAD